MASFDDLEKIEKEHNIGGDEWYRPRKLEPGTYAFKVLSDFEVKAEYWSPKDNRAYIQVGIDKNPAEKDIPEDDKRIAYLLYILDRRDNKIKLAEIGHRIMKDIGGLKKTPGYEFDRIPPYDILLKKEKTGSAAKDVKYTVIPGRDGVALTPEQEKILASKETPASIISKMKEKRIKELGGTTLNI